MSTTEAAEYLAVATSTVGRWLTSGKLRGRKVEGQWRILRSDLDAHASGATAASGLDPREKVKQLLENAMRAWSDGALAYSRSCLDEALRMDPGNPDAQAYLQRMFPKVAKKRAATPPARPVPRKPTYKPTIGIDFGTTNTVAAWVAESGQMMLVPVTEKSQLLPSVVWYGGGDKILVGHLAREKIIDDPVHTVVGSKRLLGRRYRSEFVSRHKDYFPFEVVDDGSGGTAALLHDELVRFDDVAFQIIHRMLELSNAAAGLEFDDAVITVPAHFSFLQRRAIRTAAEMAGLEVRAVVNEPTAAALYYAKHRSEGGTLLVFDLGGGTFDTTLLTIEHPSVRVLSTAGDAFLGGQDFDEIIVDRLIQDFEEAHGENLQGNPVVMQRLRFAAEQAKIELSTKKKVRIRVPFVSQKDGGFIDVDYLLSRAEFEDLTKGLVARCLFGIDEPLKAAGLTEADVSELVLVGGQTRMPRLLERLTQRFAIDHDKNVHPQLGVAVGAAVLGRSLSEPGGAALADVVPVPIGIMIPGASSQEVVHKNTPLPCVERTPLARPGNGRPLRVAVYEAFDSASAERELLGMVEVPKAWLSAHAGNLELEMRMGRDFDLGVAILAEGGGSLSLELKPPTRRATRRF